MYKINHQQSVVTLIDWCVSPMLTVFQQYNDFYNNKTENKIQRHDNRIVNQIRQTNMCKKKTELKKNNKDKQCDKTRKLKMSTTDLIKN